jgi:hypothetical protein
MLETPGQAPVSTSRTCRRRPRPHRGLQGQLGARDEVHLAIAYNRIIWRAARLTNPDMWIPWT